MGLADSPYIKSLVVEPKFRGQGIGYELLRFAEDLFSAESKHIFLCVSSFNDRARKFYERCGYFAVGVLKDYIVSGEDEILMQKRFGVTEGAPNVPVASEERSNMGRRGRYKGKAVELV